MKDCSQIDFTFFIIFLVYNIFWMIIIYLEKSYLKEKIK